jgi:hypothetical protein
MMPYQCFALRKTVYGPAMRLIASITNASQALVTTTFAHGYIDGTVVRFDIPPALGMPQINQMTSNIVVTGPTTFKTTINSTLFQPFVIPVGLSPHVDVCGLVVPIGSDNDTLAPAVVNLLNPQI